MGDRSKGLFGKYNIERTDGEDYGEGAKHPNCDLFVLDVTHDPAARVALETYIEEIKDEYPVLAVDLTKLLLKPRREKGS